MAVLRIENLTHLYSPGTPFEMTAIRDLNLSVEKGEIVAVIGHTGSGKSTLVQHLNGLLKPYQGSVYLDDVDIWAEKSKIRSVRFRVGLCFQYPEYQLFEETVYKDISFGPKNMGLSKEEIHMRVVEAMRFVGLSPSYEEKSPFDLSGGEKRRVAVAGVLAMDPEVLIMDEPTAGLDPRGRDMILELIRNYQKEKQNTVLLVSHSMEDVAKLADRVLVMNKGEIAMLGTVEQVYSRGEELRGMGLNVPQVTRVFARLKELGADVDANVFTVEEGVRRLSALLSGKAGGMDD